jgi:hypothetical protein
MECRDAQFYLRLRRHAADELGADVTAALDGHCATCAACSADARSAAQFDRAVASAMKAVPVPAGLRERLITQAARAQGAALRQKAYRVGGMVAAALLLAGLTLSLISTNRPKPNTDGIVESVTEQMNGPELSTRKWLAAHKLPDELPLPDLDYDLLVACEVVKVQDRDVPMVLFRSSEGSGFAKVYIFSSDGSFDLRGMRDAQASHATAKVVTGEGRFHGFTYVFVYTGRDLGPFLRSRNGNGIRI